MDLRTELGYRIPNTSGKYNLYTIYKTFCCYPDLKSSVVEPENKPEESQHLNKIDELSNVEIRPAEENCPVKTRHIENSRLSASLLIVDDNPIYQKVVDRYFTTHGYVIQCANNGIEALEYTSNIYFDVILCDVQMPQMDGIEFGTIVTRNCPNTTLILYSDYDILNYSIGGTPYPSFDFFINERLTPKELEELIFTL